MKSEFWRVRLRKSDCHQHSTYSEGPLNLFDPAADASNRSEN